MKSAFAMRSLAYKSSLAVMALVLVGCHNQTSIQRSYVGNRDDCQGYAEGNIARFLQGGGGGDVRSRNAKLVTLFSDCMFDQGWTVATPQREEEIQEVPEQAANAPQQASPIVVRQNPQQPKVQPQPVAPVQSANPNRRMPSQQFDQ